MSEDIIDYLLNYDAKVEMAKIPAAFTLEQEQKRTDDIFTDFTKIKLKINAKGPSEMEWTTNPKTHYKKIDLKEHNAGILCGPINNIIILDVDDKQDKKKNGIAEFKEYVKKYGMFNTLTIATPNNGYHYYFNYTSANKDDAYLLKKFINHTGLRGAGLDIRTEGGFGVAPGSCIDGRYYNIINNVDKIDMPNNLINWLTEYLKISKPISNDQTHHIKHHINNNEYTYILNDSTFKNILYKLDDSYYNNYSDWLRVSTICKFHNKYDIWDEWSKQSTSYNNINNNKIWNSILGNIDINYLTNILEIKRIHKYKTIDYNKKFDSVKIDTIYYNNKYTFEEHKKNKELYDLQTFNKKYEGVQFDFKTFNKYSTLILKASSGSGKTTATAAHVQKLLEQNKDLKFLSIVDRISLASQHKKSFKNINMKSYKDKKEDNKSLKNIKPNKNKSQEKLKKNAYVICINSLMKLEALTKEELKNYVVYIDEITSFLELTQNDTLNGCIKRVYQFLTRIIRYAHKVIVSDAIIFDNTFEFLKIRIDEEHKEETENKAIFITNEYKKFKGVKAVRVRDENIFLQKIINECMDKKPFLFGCDSATIAERFYNACKEATPNDQHDKFILLTAQTNIEVYDAETQFKDKFVFYSPCITYGVDFNINTPQNVYMYQKGNSILPFGTWQQTIRCRNIKTLYVYSEVKPQEIEYKQLEEIKQNMRDNIDFFKDSIYNISTVYDEIEDREIIIENSFFNIYCYTEYLKSIYKMNMTQHYIDILLDNGFVITEEGKPDTLDPVKKAEIQELTQEIKDKLFQEFLEDENKKDEKYDSFNKSIEFLKIPLMDIQEKINIELLNEYKNEITDKHVLQDHINIIRLLKEDIYIEEKILTAKTNSYDIKNMSSIYSKVKAIRNLEAKYNIKMLEVDYKNEGIIDMSDLEYKYIKSIFRITKAKPKNYEELKKIYVTMIKNVTTNDIIITKKSKEKETRDQRFYNLNEDVINRHLKLNKFSNIYNKKFHEIIKEKFNIIEVKDQENIYKNIYPFYEDTSDKLDILL